MSSRALSFLFSFAILWLGFLVLIIVQSAVWGVSAYVSCPNAECGVERHESSVAKKSLPFVPVPPDPMFLKSLSAAAIVAVDDETETVLFDVSSTVSRPLASITKLMTALILTELPVMWNATTTITEADSDGSHSHVRIGETFTAAALWNASLVGSSNTAVRALVRMHGLTEEQFTALMNAKARRLAMPSLMFVEPTGLDARNVGTARDVARLLRFALMQDVIRSTLARDHVLLSLVKQPPRTVWNTNWLLTRWIPHSFAGPVVGKTGYIGDAGYNVALKMQFADQRAVRVVILGSSLPENRFLEARAVGEWVFKQAVYPTAPAVRLDTNTSVY